jgi:hypothetical protein
LENCYCTIPSPNAPKDNINKTGIIIDKKDMMCSNALNNMPLLDSNTVEPSDNIIELPYDNLEVGKLITVRSNEQIGDASVAVMTLNANKDGTIYSEIRSTIESGDEVYCLKYKITKIENYEASTCTLHSELISGNDGFFSFYMEGKDLYIMGAVRDGSPTMSATFKIQVSSDGVSTPYYINDYEYPHLKSFAKGWIALSSSTSGSSNIVINSDEPDASKYAENTIWIKPI